MKVSHRNLLTKAQGIWREMPSLRANAEGKVGYALLWLMGIPLPVLLVIYFIRGH